MNRCVGVIGQGFVGGSLTTVLSERGFQVYTYDKSGKQARGGRNSKIHRGRSLPVDSSKELVLTCENDPQFSKVYFVCLPTPMSSDGTADLSIVESVLDEIAEVPGERIAVVKSTVPPGSTEMWNKRYASSGLHVIFQPEFLTEANALDDMRNQNRIIVGGPRPWVNTVKLIFQTAFPKVPIIKTSSTNAELVKYFTNVHLATRVVLSCEFKQICDALYKEGLNVDYDKVLEYAKYDPRLGGTHMNVPGNDGVSGARGHCVTAGTLVTTSLGLVPVEDIKKGQTISSSNFSLSEVDTKLVTKTSSRAYTGDVIEFAIVVDNTQRTLTCTPEHLLPVRRNNETIVIMAKDVTIDDELFTI